MTTRLLPCPFCGSSDVSLNDRGVPSCRQCLAAGPTIGIRDSFAAADAWNWRWLDASEQAAPADRPVIIQNPDEGGRHEGAVYDSTSDPPAWRLVNTAQPVRGQVRLWRPLSPPRTGKL